jgi:diphthamide synthase subunit DPH2
MTITICGSVAFAREIKKAQTFLEKNGHKTYIPTGLSLYLKKEQRKKHQNNWGSIEGAKRKIRLKLIKDYYQKIKRSDAILVVNGTKMGIRGYIGGNTFLEMGFAHVLDKKIYVLNPLPKKLKSIYQELLALKPIIIRGNLAEVK